MHEAQEDNNDGLPDATFFPECLNFSFQAQKHEVKWPVHKKKYKKSEIAEFIFECMTESQFAEQLQKCALDWSFKYRFANDIYKIIPII